MKEELKQKATECWDKRWNNKLTDIERWEHQKALPFDNYIDGFSDGYIVGAAENGIQWHKVTDDKLPELDKKVWVIRSANDDIPMIAKRHIYTSYGRTEWEWKCYWGSGFDLKQNEIFAWCEIPQFKER